MHRLSFEKVFLHTDHLARYMRSGDTPPVHCIVGLTTYCNHACVWCYAGYAQENPKYNVKAEPEVLLPALAQMRERGLKSVSIVGEGEPLVHPKAASILRRIGEMGIEIGVYTNGVHLKGETRDVLLEYARFVRLSFNGGAPDEYRKIHRSQAKDYQTVIDNAREFVRLRGESRFPTLGAQCVINEDNYRSPHTYAAMWKEIGANYVAFKPAYKNEANREHSANQVQLGAAITEMKRAVELGDSDFHVYVKLSQFKIVLEAAKRDPSLVPLRTTPSVVVPRPDPVETRGYDSCGGQAFVTCLTASGDLFVCGNLTGSREYCLGNVGSDGGFSAVWESERRRRVVDHVNTNLHRCPEGCRLDPLNKILYGLEHPDPDIHPAFL